MIAIRRVVLVCGFFFFQAEDGIRDLVRSRGLGDVYKRQGMNEGAVFSCNGRKLRNVLYRSGFVVDGHHRDERDFTAGCHHPVSYTHLTLPTSDLV